MPDMTTHPAALPPQAGSAEAAPAALPPHAREAGAVLAALGAAPGGLSEAEAAARLARHGPNRLPEAPRKSALRRFVAQFDNVLIHVLLVAAGVTGALGHWVDTGVILAVVLVNAVIGFVQEGRAEAAIEAIRRMLAPRATVLRDGRRVTVPGEEVVPGDIVLVEAGDRVPADLRLIEARGLAADEAMLTGESVPVSKAVGPVAPDAPLGDRRSMLWSGTGITQGTGRGVVVATGAATELGRIGGLVAGVEPLATPLTVQMDRFARWLSLFIVLVAALLLVWVWAVAHREFRETFMAVVGIAVAAIPEGLPAVMTITLAIGVQAMARRNAIVRRLPAIEAIGSVSVICSDKTGTLTRNEMLAATVATAEGTARVTGEGYAPEGRIDPALDLARLAAAAALCNDAELVRREGGWGVEGDPMEGALLALALKAGPDPRSTAPRRDAIPFDARHRYMAVLTGEGADACIWVKGAPERVLLMCRDVLGPEGTGPLDLHAWHARADAIAAEGQRVLAFAMLPVPGARAIDARALEGGLTLLGLVGLIDPPRPEAVAAVAECRRAGIRVKMITGDHAGTAAAIGRQIGLEHDRVLTGADLDKLDAGGLSAAVLACDVFARTSPEHKLRLVEALQAHGLSVAMTGDGVNDAPALRRADVGIAMGLKGSEAAKEAADLVLADDNFASIAAAVREGRTVWDNLRKVIAWTLPTNAGESLVIVLALLSGAVLPLTPVMILWVNMITAVTLGLALAFEPTEPGTMQRPPRPRHTPILTGALVWQVVLVGVLFALGIKAIFLYAVDQGHSVALAQTVAMNALVVLEICYLFHIRMLHGSSFTWDAVRGTRVVWLVVGLATAAQFAVTYLPPLQRVFGTAAVPLAEGLLIVALGAVFLVLIETEKQMRLALGLRA
jgi:calcium-translocating P-type ATPase